MTDGNEGRLVNRKRVQTQPHGILACAPGLHERVLPAVADAIRSRTQG